MNKTKLLPGTFLEIDDMAGGRRVVMVGRDGVTFWDSSDSAKVTPLVVHPVMHPVELGSLISFTKSKRLEAAARSVMESLRARMDARRDDSLFVMRVLWSLAPKVQGENWVPDDELLSWALQVAEEQGVSAGRIHSNAAAYQELRT